MAMHLTGMKSAECIISNQWHTYTFYIVLFKTIVRLYRVLYVQHPSMDVYIINLLQLLISVVADLTWSVLWSVNLKTVKSDETMSGQIIKLCIAMCICLCVCVQERERLLCSDLVFSVDGLLLGPISLSYNLKLVTRNRNMLNRAGFIFIRVPWIHVANSFC